jgi:hypothetical protein
MLSRRCLLAPLFALVALLSLTGVSAAHSSSLEVVASGLDNPRGLDIGHWGQIYVAEAGRGGGGPCVGDPEEEGVSCAGASGAVTKIWHGNQRRVVEGLPSLATPGSEATEESDAVPAGSDAIGPSDISLGFFSAYLTVGLGQNPAVRADLGPLGPSFGQLYRISPFGRVRPVADISAYEAAANPDGNTEEGGVDSNPNSVLARPTRRYVVDAGANDLLRVGPTGRIRTVAVFPQRIVAAPPGIPDLPEGTEIPMQAVPTNVVQGPDGALYVSQLTGFPFPVGAANIYRVERRGGEPEVYASGFTNVTDLDFGPDGSLYVVEIATNGLLSGDPTGALKRIPAGGGPAETIASEGLVAPYGVTVSHKGRIYVSTHSTEPGTGEVVRVHPGG